jgi:hypothetical protein
MAGNILYGGFLTLMWVATAAHIKKAIDISATI